MNVLILYPFSNQRRLMHVFASMLSRYGIYVDSISIDTFIVDRNSLLRWPFVVDKIFKYTSKAKKGIVARVLRYISYHYMLGKIFGCYDIIDFHAYYPFYNRLMEKCVHNKYPFDITLWGSDLMRASCDRVKILRYGFDNCHIIKMTDNLHDLMICNYGYEYDDKSRIVYFGNSDFPVIDSLSDADTSIIKNRLYGEVGNKRILVLGYNGLPSQNHVSMLNALSLLTEDEMKSIHVVLPMTYGATKDYIKQILGLIGHFPVTYTLLDKFLTSEEVAVVRKTADIVINIQTTDALAGSLQDHLYCGNICIIGDWLNYGVYSDNGIYYIKTTSSEVSLHIKQVLANYNEYKIKCEDNHIRLKQLLSWESTISKQVRAYDE